MTDEVAFAIEKLTALEKRLNELKEINNSSLNIFDAVGMTTQEIKHSAFLAWLLDPQNPHGFENEFLKTFLNSVYNYQPEGGAHNSEILGGTHFLELAEDKDITVLTERPLTIEDGGRIDIYVEAPNNKIILVIENKVLSTTHDEQLKRYEEEFSKLKDWTKVFVYLTPKGDLPFEDGKLRENWCSFDYREILKILQKFKPTNRKVKYLTEDYVDMVNNNILNGNKEIAALCKKIRREHKYALDILFNYTDIAKETVKYCSEWLKNNIPDLIFIKDTDTVFEFYSKKMQQFFANHGEDIALSDKTLKLRCSCGYSETVGIGISLQKNEDEDWYGARRIILNAFAPTKTSTTKYCSLNGYSTVLLPSRDREKDFDSIKDDLNIKLLQFAKMIKEFENKLLNL